MEYTPLQSIPHYAECAPLVEALGYVLVDIKVVQSRGNINVNVVIAAKDAAVHIGVNDCAKVHRVLLPKIEDVLHTDDVYMELTSPGMERNIKNPAEFALFKGRELRVWSREAADWVGGTIAVATEHSVTLLQEGDTERVIPYSDIAKAKFIHN
mgnify:CR=1 FL=1